MGQCLSIHRMSAQSAQEGVPPAPGQSGRILRPTPVKRGQCRDNGRLATLQGRLRAGWIGIRADLGTWGTTPCLNLNIHSHYKGAKNLSLSSLCLKAAISLLWKSRRRATSSPRSSDFFTSCLLVRQAESLFLFSFFKRGRGGVLDSIFKPQPFNKIRLGTGPSSSLRPFP